MKFDAGSLGCAQDRFGRSEIAQDRVGLFEFVHVRCYVLTIIYRSGELARPIAECRLASSDPATAPCRSLPPCSGMCCDVHATRTERAHPRGVVTSASNAPA